MANTILNQSTAVSLQLTDYALLWQGGQSPSTRKMPISNLATYYLALTGGTITGDVTFSAAKPKIKGNAGTVRAAQFLTGSTVRWQIDANATAESGTNAGSDFELWSYTDAGAQLVKALSITRSTGTATFGAGVTASAPDSGGAQFRAISGNYGFIIRTDGTSANLLQTASGDQNGTFTTLRPFAWDLSTGKVTIDGTGAGTTIAGQLTVSGSALQTGLSGWSYNSSGGGSISGASVTIAVTVGSSGMLASTYVATSDIRVKSEILDITAQQGEVFVRSSRPKTYLKQGIKESGFVAQDMVRAGYEHMVNSSPCEGLAELTEDGLTSKQDVMLSLAYDQTIAYLTAALKGALARIDALEAKAR